MEAKDVPLEKFTNLYWATRYFAFGERPISPVIAELLYEKIDNYPDCEIQSQWSCQSGELYDQMRLGFNKLRAGLISGKYIAYGCPYYLKDKLNEDAIPNATEFLQYYTKHTHTQMLIPSVFWSAFDLEWDFLNNAIESVFEGIFFDKKKGEVIAPSAYDQIEIEVKSFMPNIFLKGGKGRPSEYDWEAFNLHIISIANHPDGLPETQAELQRIMAEWCDINWPKTPGETSLKSKISYIYQYIDKVSKST